jgi:hypothetical protein
MVIDGLPRLPRHCIDHHPDVSLHVCYLNYYTWIVLLMGLITPQNVGHGSTDLSLPVPILLSAMNCCSLNGSLRVLCLIYM